MFPSGGGGGPQRGFSGTDFGPQGRINVKVFYDKNKAEFAQRSAPNKVPLYGNPKGEGDVSIETHEIVWMMKPSVRTGYQNSTGAVVYSSLNGIFENVKRRFGNDVNEYARFLKTQIILVGTSYSSIRPSMCTGGVTGTHVTATVAGTFPSLAQENLAPGDLMVAMPPDPREEGSWARQNGISQGKAVFELRKFNPKTIREEYEAIIEGRVEQRRTGVKKPSNYYYEGSDEMLAMTIENFGLMTVMMGAYGLSEDIFNTTFKAGMDFSDGTVVPFGPEEIVMGLAYYWGMIPEPPPGVRIDANLKKIYMKQRDKLLNYIFLTKKSDKEFHFSSDGDKGSKFYVLQKELGGENMLACAEITQRAKSAVFCSVLIPAEKGMSATMLRPL